MITPGLLELVEETLRQECALARVVSAGNIGLMDLVDGEGEVRAPFEERDGGRAEDKEDVGDLTVHNKMN